MSLNQLAVAAITTFGTVVMASWDRFDFADKEVGPS